jgi:hypothetical protein
MSKPILVGYDPATLDPAPVRFGAAAARFTGARLIIASVHARVSAGNGGASEEVDEDLATEASDATQALADIERDLAAEGVAVKCQAMENTSALARCTRRPKAKTPACSWSARPGGDPLAACCRGRLRSG